MSEKTFQQSLQPTKIRSRKMKKSVSLFKNIVQSYSTYRPEPYKIKAVEKINLVSKEERIRNLEEAGYNTFLLPSEGVFLDFLTDSGTSAMSDKQWAGMMVGDEAYAGSVNFDHLQASVEDVFGYPYLIPTHQGRAAEHIAAQIMLKDIRPGFESVPRNMYFTTSKAHVVIAGGYMPDVVIDEAHDPHNLHPFKGNVCLEKLREHLEGGEVCFLSIEANCNMSGGQPFSIENIRAAREMCDEYDVPIILDSTRVTENAYFIKEREHPELEIVEILHEIHANSMGCTMSSKKDGLVNIGGFIATHNEEFYKKCQNMVVIYEGLHTYGGMAGRDMEALAIGLREATEYDYLESRVSQTQYLGELLKERGVPVVEPFGSHAIYLNAAEFLPHIPREEFPSQALAAMIYRESGIRTMERGAVSKGRDENGENIYPPLELVRITIPRRVYTKAHFEYTADRIAEVYEMRESVQGLEFIYEPEVLRFFQSRFELTGGEETREASMEKEEVITHIK